jgi:UDP-N-acetylglucosamine/UDP-N-acetylgalactosamine diphosphorylase
MSSKAIVKTSSTEKVGNFCLAGDRVTVIEYSDLSDEQSSRVNPDGSLVFQLGSIAIHIINTAFVEELNAGSFALPIHRAVKKIQHIDSNGRKIDPSEPNGVKLETFVFDALPLADKSIILETIRSQEFAPAKNASGTDSVEAAKKMIAARAAEWLENAGITVPKRADGTPDCTIEIAPSFAIEKQDIIEKKDRVPTINPGDKIYLE